MRLKMFENFDSGRSYRQLEPNFSNKEITVLPISVVSLLDSFCEEYRLKNKNNVSISHDEIKVIDDEYSFIASGPTLQWDIKCYMNLSIDIYTSDSNILSKFYEYTRNKFIDRIKSKYYVYTFKKYEYSSDIDILVKNEDGDILPNVWIGAVTIVLGKN